MTEYTKIKLKSGLVAVIMEVFDDGGAFLVEVETEPDSWEIFTVNRSDIASVLKEKIVNLEGV
jgi:preprotein translocase subunit YajC